MFVDFWVTISSRSGKRVSEPLLIFQHIKWYECWTSKKLFSNSFRITGTFNDFHEDTRSLDLELRGMMGYQRVRRQQGCDRGLQLTAGDLGSRKTKTVNNVIQTVTRSKSMKSNQEFNLFDLSNERTSYPDCFHLHRKVKRSFVFQPIANHILTICTVVWSMLTRYNTASQFNFCLYTSKEREKRPKRRACFKMVAI